jgi:teichoic acid transport system ATP-binding protein
VAEPSAQPVTHGAARSSGGLDDGDVTVRVEDVHMTYTIYEDRRPRLRTIVANGFKQRPSRTIRAVQGVSFTAHSGEIIGVLGPNGSGKSTLMRGLAGLQPVNGGDIKAVSIPVLLGVGAALQRSLSARRNIELGCLALGLTIGEVAQREGEILEFAGLEDFADLPLKAYSSGMRARLHFAIATAVQPHILLIDEALSVGDEAFQERSAERIKELQKAAGTVFIVTHTMKTIEETCTRALWLDKGRLVEDGPPKAVTKAYRYWVKAGKQGASGGG